MKRILALLLAVMMILALSACSSEPEVPEGIETAETIIQTPISGGWTVNDNPAAVLPDTVQAAFDKAVAELDGAVYTPVAYIGAQVVAGANHAILCQQTLTTAEPELALKVLIIYEDLQGNAEITNIADFNIPDYVDSEGTAPEQLAGGWYAPEEVTSIALVDEAQQAYDTAVAGITGNELSPMALLGTQVVAGTNYAFLCHSTLVTAEPVSCIQIVTVFDPLEGDPEVTNIHTLSIADFNA